MWEDSMMALRTKAEPVSRWHPRGCQWGWKWFFGRLTAAVAAVDDEGYFLQAVSDVFAGAAALHGIRASSSHSDGIMDFTQVAI
jgi:hypothetical protein